MELRGAGQRKTAQKKRLADSYRIEIHEYANQGGPCDSGMPTGGGGEQPHTTLREERASEGGEERAAQKPKRLRQARAFSRCSVIDRRWRNMTAQEFVVSSSPVAKAEDLASSDQTPLAIFPHPPPTASMIMGVKVIPWA